MLCQKDGVLVPMLATLLVLTVMRSNGRSEELPEGSPVDRETASPTDLSLPGLPVSKETEQLLQRLQLQLTEAQDADDLDTACRVADELVSVCEMFLGSKAWQTALAQHYRAEVNRLRFLTDDERQRVQEARTSFQTARKAFAEGRLEQAQALASEAKQVQQKLLGPCSPSHVETLRFLAHLSHIQRQFHENDKLLIEMAAICRQAYGIDSPHYAEALSNLGVLYASMGIFPQAETALKQAADIRKRTLGLRSAAYVESLSSLGFLYCRMDQYDKAEPAIREALSLSKELDLTLNTTYADCVQNLGHIVFQKGSYAEAEPLLHEAVQINEIFIGSRRGQLLVTLDRLVTVLKKLEKDEEALDYQKRLQALRDEHRSGGPNEDAQRLKPEDK